MFEITIAPVITLLSDMMALALERAQQRKSSRSEDGEEPREDAAPRAGRPRKGRDRQEERAAS